MKKQEKTMTISLGDILFFEDMHRMTGKRPCFVISIVKEGSSDYCATVHLWDMKDNQELRFYGVFTKGVFSDRVLGLLVQNQLFCLRRREEPDQPGFFAIGKFETYDLRRIDESNVGSCDLK